MSGARKILVAGVGNIFLGDDGFGVEVARRLAGESPPGGVTVADFGIRGVHLAYELLEGYDTTILVDAAPRGGEPGTVYVVEVDVDDPGAGIPSERAGEEGALVDAHGMEPQAVFGLLRALGAAAGRVLVVGCEPAEVTDRIGLSDPVARAVDEAVRVVGELVRDELGEASSGAWGGAGVGKARRGSGGSSSEAVAPGSLEGGGA
ncbi:MAG TPA: hydrogenase maturation protease [Actinomycetota bacterium]|nr:hydrogenase maturation protease [Actinomycetota bacterium]